MVVCEKTGGFSADEPFNLARISLTIGLYRLFWVELFMERLGDAFARPEAFANLAKPVAEVLLPDARFWLGAFQDAGGGFRLKAGSPGFATSCHAAEKRATAFAGVVW